MGIANLAGVLVCFAGARRYGGSWFLESRLLFVLGLQAALFLPAALPVVLPALPGDAFPGGASWTLRIAAFALSLGLFVPFARRNLSLWSPARPAAPENPP
jgi:hypothetical protein